MRILFISDASSLHTKRWTEWFAGRGHEVLLASLEKPLEMTVPFRRLPGGSSWLSYLSAALPLKRIVKEFKPELLNAHYVTSYGLMGTMSGFHPLAVSAWGSDLLISAKRSSLHRMRAKKALARADLATCDGKNLEAELARLGVSDGRILNLPLGVDAHLIIDRPPVLLRDRLYKIICTRSLEPIYDVETIIRAMPLVVESISRSVHLTVVGGGRLREKLERLARELGVENRIEFTGRLEHSRLIDELDRAGIYVTASRSDSTSVSLLEAMGRGLVPVASDIEGNREWIQNGVNGLLFMPGDHAGLAQRLIEVMGGRWDVAGFVKMNLGLVREKGCWQRNMERVEQAFCKLVS